MFKLFKRRSTGAVGGLRSYDASPRRLQNIQPVYCNCQHWPITNSRVIEVIFADKVSNKYNDQTVEAHY